VTGFRLVRSVFALEAGLQDTAHGINEPQAEVLFRLKPRGARANSLVKEANP